MMQLMQDQSFMEKVGRKMGGMGGGGNPLAAAAAPPPAAAAAPPAAAAPDINDLLDAAKCVLCPARRYATHSVRVCMAVSSRPGM